MSDTLVVQSHRGPYTVAFDDRLIANIAGQLDGDHFVIDANVSRIYASKLKSLVDRPSTIVLEATEEQKSIDQTIGVVTRLLESKVRRRQRLIAIGGGIIQDVVCFVASTLFRGLEWQFVPTTLLAQADSCIGSKSSINVRGTKNVLGTYHPPTKVYVDPEFLNTLDPRDIHSGIGEIIKVHAIDGPAAFDELAAGFGQLLRDRTTLLSFIRASLRIKQRFIEADEFDQGIRNVLNYGHSFGHAIEAASDFRISHGIAVSIGMDLANYVSAARNLMPRRQFDRMHPVLAENYRGYSLPIDVVAMLSALAKDKKNTSSKLALILPVGDDAEIQRLEVERDTLFDLQCRDFFDREYCSTLAP